MQVFVLGGSGFCTLVSSLMGVSLSYSLVELLHFGLPIAEK